MVEILRRLLDAVQSIFWVACHALGYIVGLVFSGFLRALDALIPGDTIGNFLDFIDSIDMPAVIGAFSYANKFIPLQEAFNLFVISVYIFFGFILYIVLVKVYQIIIGIYTKGEIK